MLLRSHMPWKHSGTWTNWKDHGQRLNGNVTGSVLQFLHLASAGILLLPITSLLNAGRMHHPCAMNLSGRISLSGTAHRSGCQHPSESPSAPTKRISTLSRRLQHACADHGRGGGEPAQPRGKTAYYPVRPAND